MSTQPDLFAVVEPTEAQAAAVHIGWPSVLRHSMPFRNPCGLWVWCCRHAVEGFDAWAPVLHPAERRS